MSETAEQAASRTASPPIRSLRLKVGLLAALTVLLSAAFVVYVLYARGVFEPTQRLILLTDSAEGVTVGMDLTLAGFPVGRVVGIRLQDNNLARIRVAVPTIHASRLRTTSQFVLERGIVGGTRLRVYTTDASGPPLAHRAEVRVHRGDVVETLPQMLADLKQAVENVRRLTAEGQKLDQSIDNVHLATERLKGKHGALEAVLGTPENAAKVMAAIERSNALLASLQGLAARSDALVLKADQRLFARGGMADEAQRTVAQLNALLGDARESLKKADAVLANAQAASANVKDATADLSTLRAEVEASLRKVGHLIDEVNRKWPFERDTEVRLP